MTRDLKELFFRFGITIGVVSGAIIVLFTAYDLSRVVTIYRGADIGKLLMGAVAFYITYPLRTRRWRLLLSNLDIKTGWRSANLLVVVSHYLNVIFPAKLGDLHRSYQAAKTYSSEFTIILGTVVSERVFDLVAITSLFAVLFPITLQVVGGRVKGYPLWAATVAGSVLLIIPIYWCSKYVPLPEWVRSIINQFRSGLTAIRDGPVRRGIEIAVISYGIWALSVLRFTLVASALGMQVGILQLATVALLIALLSGIPYVPAGMGFVEVIGPSVLVAWGITGEKALALVLLDRTVTVGSLLVIGTAVYISYRFVYSTGGGARRSD